MSRPRILVLTTSAQIKPAAGGRTRIVSEVRYVLGGQYDGMLLALVPGRQWIHPVKLARSRVVLEADSGFPVRYRPGLTYLGQLWLWRIAKWISARWVLSAARKLGAQGIHAHGQSAAAIALLARKWGFAGWILFDAHGGGPEEYAMAAADPDPRWIAELRREERAVLTGADEVVCVSEALRTHYEATYELKLDCSSIVPCATNTAVRFDAGARRRLRAQYQVDKRFVLAYAGSYRKYQMADETVALFRAIREAMAEAFLFIFTGDQSRFAQAIRNSGLKPEGCHLLFLPHQELLQTLPLADVGFLLRTDSSVNRLASPTKFAEYCICGVPVLTTPFVGDYSRRVEQERLGYCLRELKVSNPLLHFLREVQSNRETFATRCHQYAKEHLTWQHAGEVLLDAYARLSNKHRHAPDQRAACRLSTAHYADL